MATECRKRLAQCRALNRTCDVRGCHMPTQKWGRWCDKHDKINERTGHPRGHTIRVATVKPLIKPIRNYIRENRDHPSIQQALLWLYELVYGPRSRVQDIHRKSKPEDRLGRFLDKMKAQNVHEVDMLAIIVAMYLMRELYPNDFKTDRHFRHQIATRLLRMVNAPRKEKWGGGHAIYIYDRITVGVRELLGPHLETNLGLLCNQIARLHVDVFVPPAPIIPELKGSTPHAKSNPTCNRYPQG